MLLLLLTAAPLLCQDAGRNEPAWLVYQRGLDFFRSGEFGETVKIVKQLSEKYGEIPEALYLQGQVYEQEGEYALAEKYYERALELRKQLYVLDDRFAISYRLAEIYRVQKRYREYEMVLLEILKEHDAFANPRLARLRDSYLRVLSDEGFDALVNLYRLRSSFAQKAHGEIGILYCRTGRTYQAVLHLVFFHLSALSSVAEELKKHDPDFVYGTLSEVLDLMKNRPYLAEYFSEIDYFKHLYFLASALFSHGIPAEARKLWRIVAAYGVGEWKNLSASQLKKPRSEPLLSY